MSMVDDTPRLRSYIPTPGERAALFGSNRTAPFSMPHLVDLLNQRGILFACAYICQYFIFCQADGHSRTVVVQFLPLSDGVYKLRVMNTLNAQKHLKIGNKTFLVKIENGVLPPASMAGTPWNPWEWFRQSCQDSAPLLTNSPGNELLFKRVVPPAVFGATAVPTDEHHYPWFLNLAQIPHWYKYEIDSGTRIPPYGSLPLEWQAGAEMIKNLIIDLWGDREGRRFLVWLRQIIIDGTPPAPCMHIRFTSEALRLFDFIRSFVLGEQCCAVNIPPEHADDGNDIANMLLIVVDCTKSVTAAATRKIRGLISSPVVSLLPKTSEHALVDKHTSYVLVCKDEEMSLDIDPDQPWYCPTNVVTHCKSWLYLNNNVRCNHKSFWVGLAFAAFLRDNCGKWLLEL